MNAQGVRYAQPTSPQTACEGRQLESSLMTHVMPNSRRL